jgi:hypothetical protein
MPLTQLAPPYPIFTDKNGDPLDAGYLYFGTANLNPETNPIQVYYDAALTQPAAQPIRTINGYPSRNGSPALIYANAQFSVTVRNKNNELVIYSPVGYGIIPGTAATNTDQMTYNQGGTGAVSRILTARLQDYVSVKDFGAVGDGVTDDTVAIQAAAATGKAIGLVGGSYFITSTVTITNNLIGPGEITGDASGGATILVAVDADNVLIADLTLTGNSANAAAAANIAITAEDTSWLTIQNCTIKNGRIRHRNTQLAYQYGLRVQNCDIDCDFSLNDFLTTQNDVITVRGINGVWIENNNISVTNCHRVAKLADTEAWTTADPITAYRTRNVSFCNNKIVGSTGSNKQVVDMFAGTTDAILSGNNIVVTGFSRVFENKTDSWAQNFPLNNTIVDNHLSNDSLVLNFAGTLGDSDPSVDVGFQNLRIVGNVIIRSGMTAGSAVDIRWMHRLDFSRNTIVVPTANNSGTGTYSANLYSCEHMQTEGNSFNSAYQVSAITSGGNRTHNAPMRSIVMQGNAITDWNGSSVRGGIVFRALSSAEVADLCISCVGNSIRQELTAAVGVAGCIALDTVTIKKFVATGNVGNAVADPTDERIRLVSATVAQLVDENNSWNLIGSVSATYDPPSILNGDNDSTTVAVTGAALGDFVEVSFSRNLANIIMTAWVSAVDTVTVLLQNESGGTVDLASGTLRVRVMRYAA